MNAKGKNAATASANTDWLGRMYVGMQLIPRGAILTAIGPLILGVAAYLGWRYWGAERFDRAMYSLTESSLDVTPQPVWVPGNVKEEVMRSGVLEQVSLLDRQATSTIARAFDAHPWIKKTVLVEKLAGGSVRVTLNYRRPMAMVSCQQPGTSPAGDSNTSTQEVLYAVDEDGVVLPSEGFKVVGEGYFRIVAEGAKPPTIAGAAYGDARINEALQLCQLLEPKRAELGLQSVHVLRDTQATGTSPWVLGLITTDGRQIMWGHAPGHEQQGEPKVEEKFQRMVSYLKSEVSKLPASKAIDLRIAP